MNLCACVLVECLGSILEQIFLYIFLYELSLVQGQKYGTPSEIKITGNGLLA